MEKGRAADKRRPGANAHEWPSNGMPRVKADCSYSMSDNTHGSRATVESSAARMSPAAPAAAREDGVCAYQQRHSQQNRNRSFHWSLLFTEYPAHKKCNASDKPTLPFYTYYTWLHPASLSTPARPPAARAVRQIRTGREHPRR